jgi:catechol 2,3-dioxygenase-like lactoylglutathione lyase family enzyme
MNPPSLGYVILYVHDVPASLAFYEKAFGLARRLFHDDHRKAYGELEATSSKSVPRCRKCWLAPFRGD